MPNHQPRPLAALRASQALPESIGRHVACARDDRRQVEVPATEPDKFAAQFHNRMPLPCAEY
jgi:hypothetical protein